MHIYYNKTKEMPTQEMFAGAATRTLDLTIKKNMAWMMFYWSKLLARAAGGISVWNKENGRKRKKVTE